MTRQQNQNEPNERSEGLRRRDVLKGTAAAGLSIATGVNLLPNAVEAAPASQPVSQNVIQRENAKPGTRDWLLTKTRTLPGKINNILLNGRSQVIEGYCSANSVKAGDKLQIMVSANPESAFKLEIFRTGYYNGDGARLVKTFDSLKGSPQADPPVGENYVRECQWEPSVEFKIPKDWLSGVYLGKLTAKKSG
ncbi:MAG: N,N-dimethylformamidase beta subunit family domain-containing protein, partial [Pirellulaceae bacterium]